MALAAPPGSDGSQCAYKCDLRGSIRLTVDLLFMGRFRSFTASKASGVISRNYENSLSWGKAEHPRPQHQATHVVTSEHSLSAKDCIAAAAPPRPCGHGGAAEPTWPCCAVSKWRFRIVLPHVGTIFWSLDLPVVCLGDTLLWIAAHAGLLSQRRAILYLFHRTDTRSREVPSLDSQILTVFLARIGESGRVDSSLAQRLGEVLGSEKLPRPEDLVRLYASCDGGDSA